MALGSVAIRIAAAMGRTKKRRILTMLQKFIGFMAILFLLVASVVASPFAYITNFYSGTVSVIDISTNTVVATIYVGGNPIGAAVNPSGTRVYVPDRYCSKVSVIETSTNTVIATIITDPAGSGQVGVVVSPSGSRVYVADFKYDFSTVSVIDTSTNSVIKKINVGNCPHGVAVNPAGTRVYVANWLSGSVSVIDTSTDLVIATIYDVGDANGIVVNPTGTRVYVTDWLSGALRTIDTSTNTAIAEVRVGGGPTGVAINPAGTHVYVANRYSPSVSVIDTSTNTIVATVNNVGIEPVGVAVNPSGTRVYVTDFALPKVSVIDTATNAVVDTINVDSESFTAYCIFIGPVVSKQVRIDIKPGSDPNSINLGSNGNVPVAIFSAADFDATTIDPLTVTLAGAAVKLKGKGTPMSSAEDIDGDGTLDLIVHVDTTALQLSLGDTEAVLEATTYDGMKIRGKDSIRVIN